MPNIAMLGAVYDTFDYITRLRFVQTIKISKRRKRFIFAAKHYIIGLWKLNR